VDQEWFLHFADACLSRSPFRYVKFQDVLLVDFVNPPIVFEGVKGFLHEGDCFQFVSVFACLFHKQGQELDRVELS